MTTNQNYATPDEGSLDWHVPLNDNFRKLDTDVEVRDTDANRSNYTPRDGAKFLATDTGRVYLGDGSSWTAIGSLGSSSDATIFEALESGNLVAIAQDLASPEVIDPAGTSTPVQDAMDLLGNNGGGEVRLPPTAVSEAGTIEPYPNTAIVGFGPTISEVSISTSGIDGIRFQDHGSGPASRVYLDGFTLNGPGLSSASGAAIHHTERDTQDLYIGRMIFWGWNNAVYRVDEGVGPFQCRHDLLTIYECDAGDENGLFEFNSWYGPANWFGTIAAYPVAGYSGKNTTLFYTKGGTQTAEYITVGGSTGTMLHQTWDGMVQMGNLHWEPTDLQTTPDSIVYLEGHGPATIGSVKQVTGTADYVYELGYDSYNANSPARKRLGPFASLGQNPTITTNVVNLTSAADPTQPSFYFGAPADVDVTHNDADTGGLRALGTAGTGMG